MGGCQNYGPFLGTLNIRCRNILGTQKGTIVLTTAHIRNVFRRSRSKAPLDVGSLGPDARKGGQKAPMGHRGCQPQPRRRGLWSLGLGV